MLGYRNPWTRKLDIPFALYKSPQAAINAVTAAAHKHDWAAAARISPVDERVVWTIHEDHLELYYRERPTDLTGGTT